MVSYYDFVLVFIPVFLLGVPGVLAGLHGVELTLAVPIGGAIAAALIAHAMFVRAPRSPTERVSVDGRFAPPTD